MKRPSVIQRSYLIYDCMAFVVLSFFLLHVEVAHIAQISAFNPGLLMKNLSYLGIFVVLQLVTLVFLWNLWPLTQYLFALVGLFVLTEGINLLLSSFTKINLILMVLHIAMTYILHLLLREELSKACHNSLVSTNFLYPLILRTPDVEIESQHVKFKAQLSNWDESSAFLVLTSPVDRPIKRLGPKVKVTFQLSESMFREEAVIVSVLGDGTGLGVKFLAASRGLAKNKKSWQTFYGMMDHMGYRPSYLR